VGGNHHSAHHGKKQHSIPPVKPWEPRTKLVAGLIYVFCVISLGDLRLLGAAFAFAVCFALWTGLTPGQLLKKLAVLVPFLALMSLPLLFSGGIPPAPDRIELAALIVMKALTAMTFTLFVFTNQPVEEMLEAMEHLKMPAAITTTIYLAYRYGFLFIHDMLTTLRALKARLFNARLSRYSLEIYGELSGGLFIKSINRSQAVYQAMAARSFQGKMPISAPRPISGADWAKAALPTVFVAVLIILEQVVL